MVAAIDAAIEEATETLEMLLAIESWLCRRVPMSEPMVSRVMYKMGYAGKDGEPLTRRALRTLSTKALGKAGELIKSGQV